MRVVRYDNEALTGPESYWLYSGLDSCMTLEIHNRLEKIIKADECFSQTYEQSLRLRNVVLFMQLKGMNMDMEKLRARKLETIHTIEKIEDWYETAIRETLHIQTNIASNQQIVEVLCRGFGVTMSGKKGSAPSVSREALEALLKKKEMYERPAIAFLIYLILWHRTLKKEMEILTAPSHDNRFRSSFNIAGAVSGRFSSEESVFGEGRNSQNVKSNMKDLIIPDEGYTLINVDLSQADSFNFGAACVWFANDDTYLKACESLDVHTWVCGSVWPGKETAEYKAKGFYRNKSMRDLAKAIGHATNYLASDRGTAAQHGMDIAVVKNFMARYFESFKCIPKTHALVIQQLKDTGVIVTIHGRKRKFWSRAADTKTQRDAMNYLGQSPTADTINKIMLKTFANLKFQPINQVHDSILFQYKSDDVSKDELEDFIRNLKITTEIKDGRTVSIPLEVQVGHNWADYEPDKNPRGMKNYELD